MSWTLILALWGAALSTILAFIEIMKFMHEKVHIKVNIRSNFKMYPEGPPYYAETLVLVTVCNDGKRPTTITHVWLMGPKNTSLLIGDCFKKGPVRIEEGNYTQYITKESDIRGKGLLPRDYVAVVSDAAGRQFYSHFIIIRLFKKIRMNLFTKHKK